MNFSFFGNKFNSFEEICDKFNYNKDKNERYDYLSEYILNLYNHKIIENDSADKLFWNGNYYRNIKRNYDEMKKYYLMAIDLNNSDAMNKLGIYYQIIEKNYDETKKYYLMAIELNNDTSMYNLAIYYQKIEKNYEKMKKYLLMAIELNNSDAMNNLGYYYQEIKRNYDEMKRYYLMAIELNNNTAMINLEFHYKDDLLSFYCLLSKIENKNDLINEKINELLQNKQIRAYKNKIKLFKSLNNYKNCIVCLEENVLHINFECGHDVCTECYHKMNKCYYNC